MGDELAKELRFCECSGCHGKRPKKMDQRIEFVMKSLNCQHFGELCREYGISRKTGYKWQH